MVRRRPLPFPPEPVASIGIQATRWSLDRADHHGGQRNLFLRTLDRLGPGLRLLSGCLPTGRFGVAIFQ